MKRYALLDTDFISKTHYVQDDGGNHLIDQVMKLPGYEFFCQIILANFSNVVDRGIFIENQFKEFPIGDIWNTIGVGGRVISKRGGLSSLFHQPVFVIESVLEYSVG